jgi:ubiquinone/menaquinone biosynthesis C-methylase UbiE
MWFSGDISRLQRGASDTADYAARRAATLSALEPKESEAILEIGCGSGILTRQIARSVGAAGRACAIDVSEDQIGAARFTCVGLANVELGIADALALPYPAATFDAIASIQVLEYIENLEAALVEISRVLKPGGRFVNFATAWGSLFWNSSDARRMRQMLAAWTAHAPHPDLPAILKKYLQTQGYAGVNQAPIAMLNSSYDPSAFSYWLAQIIATFASDPQFGIREQAQDWLMDLAQSDARNEYFFCLVGVVTRGIR